MFIVCLLARRKGRWLCAHGWRAIMQILEWTSILHVQIPFHMGKIYFGEPRYHHIIPKQEHHSRMRKRSCGVT